MFVYLIILGYDARRLFFLLALGYIEVFKGGRGMGMRRRHGLLVGGKDSKSFLRGGRRERESEEKRQRDRKGR